ncbi:hypothetical protein BD408DRAFT_407990 [Parasitella parasitica]|nr:hypothetical protein BD408DRAFT_407990 [Parasitella parasitica]
MMLLCQQFVNSMYLPLLEPSLRIPLQKKLISVQTCYNETRCLTFCRICQSTDHCRRDCPDYKNGCSATIVIKLTMYPRTVTVTTLNLYSKH